MLTFMSTLTQPAAVLSWVYTWHNTSAAVIARLLMAGKNSPDKLASNLLRRMTTQGWLRQVDNDSLQGQYIYMLSADGLEEVLASGLGSGINYDLKPSSIRHDTLRHDLGVQFIVAHLSNTQKISHVTPERVIRSKTPSAKIPDAVITIDLNDGAQAQVAIEFEREEKAGERLERFLLNVANDLTRKKYNLYMLYSRIPGIMQNYEATSKQPLNIWTKNKESKRWEAAEEKTMIPPEILSKMRFRYLPEIGAALSPLSHRRKIKNEANDDA